MTSHGTAYHYDHCAVDNGQACQRCAGAAQSHWRAVRILRGRQRSVRLSIGTVAALLQGADVAVLRAELGDPACAAIRRVARDTEYGRLRQAGVNPSSAAVLGVYTGGGG